VVLTWDGRDDEGRRVPPGIYLYELQVQSDQPLSHQVGLVSVAY
jgi:flagellar hook assembly protein FlgD